MENKKDMGNFHKLKLEMETIQYLRFMNNKRGKFQNYCMEAILHCDFFFIVFWENVSAFNTLKEKATLTLTSFSFHIFYVMKAQMEILFQFQLFSQLFHGLNIKTGIKEIMIKKISFSKLIKVAKFLSVKRQKQNMVKNFKAGNVNIQSNTLIINSHKKKEKSIYP